MKSKKIVFKSTTLLITLKKFCDINLRIKDTDIETNYENKS